MFNTLLTDLLSPQAEEFHSWVQRLRAWLSGLEQGLHYRGLIPEEEPSLQALLQSQKELMQAMQGKRQDLDRVVSLGEAILRVCHPDGFTSIKLGVASLQERYQEVGSCQWEGDGDLQLPYWARPATPSPSV